MTESAAGGGRRRKSRSGPKTDTPEKLPFEKAMVRLEEIVQILESGEGTLEDSLALFEEGAFLARQCNRQLDQAERKLEILVKKANGETSTEPLPEEEFFPAGDKAGDKQK